MNNYTEEQIKDIEERTAKVIACMEENQLAIAVQVMAANNGNDTFSFKPIPYFSDKKYAIEEKTVTSTEN